MAQSKLKMPVYEYISGDNKDNDQTPQKKLFTTAH
jgi:hypothetical protein